MVQRVGEFAFIIEMFRSEFGALNVKKRVINNNMMKEVLIMQLKALLNSLEKDYYSRNKFKF